MSAENLYSAQLKLEGLRLDGDGYLERWKDMPGGESGPPARVVAVDYGQRQCVFFGAGIDRGVEESLRNLPIRALLDGDRRVFDILGCQKSAQRHAVYRTHTMSATEAIPASPMIQRLSSRDGRLRGFGNGFFDIDYEDVFAAIVDGAVASAAASSREDEASAEIWIYTRPEHRRKGLATQAAAAWLRSMVHRGLIPFYSYEEKNEASRHLAESLRLRLCFVLSCYR
jgi:hypothetical protein